MFNCYIQFGFNGSRSPHHFSIYLLDFFLHVPKPRIFISGLITPEDAARIFSMLLCRESNPLHQTGTFRTLYRLSYLAAASSIRLKSLNFPLTNRPIVFVIGFFFLTYDRQKLQKFFHHFLIRNRFSIWLDEEKIFQKLFGFSIFFCKPNF